MPAPPNRFHKTPHSICCCQVADQAAAMFGFFAAIVLAFIIIEPVQVLLLSALPALFDEKTRCGRIISKVRWCYSEFFAP